MSKQTIITSFPGDKLPVGGDKINANFTELYSGKFEIYFDSALTPALLSAGATNNYAPPLSGINRLRISSSGAANITGMSGGTSGRFLIVTNVGANDITLNDENSGSTAANRFALNGDMILGPNEGVALVYDGGISRWTSA